MDVTVATHCGGQDQQVLALGTQNNTFPMRIYAIRGQPWAGLGFLHLTNGLPYTPGIVRDTSKPTGTANPNFGFLTVSRLDVS